MIKKTLPRAITYKFIVAILSLLCPISVTAQVGYQVSLLDTKTGEPRTNEKVTVSVKICDNKDNIICDETKSVTSDSFGVLSLTIGNENTFTKVDWSKLPLTISASVDGTLIGSSTILNVPIAEYAKQTGQLTEEIICKKWICVGYDVYQLTFKEDGTWSLNFNDGDPAKGTWSICGNSITLVSTVNHDCCIGNYSPKENRIVLIRDGRHYLYK